MIVGVDSGTWRAFAVLDFKGNLIALESRKNWTPDDFISALSDFSPSVIACDKIPVPRKVLLLKSVFGARLYKPSKSISHLQKASLTRGFHPQNSHERDALACGLKACRFLKSKLELVERKAKASGMLPSRVVLVQKLVLKGSSVDNAIRQAKVMG